MNTAHRFVRMLPVSFLPDNNRFSSPICVLFFLFVCSVTVLAQPRIIIEPQQFDFEIGEEFQQNFQFNFSNSGDEDLIWQSEEVVVEEPDRRIPERDDPGDVLDQFVWQRAGRNTIKAGIAFEPETDLLIVTCYQNNYYGILDPADNYRVVREWQAGQSLLAVTCLNGIIYAVNAGQTWLQKWDIDGNNLGRLNTGGFEPITVTSSAVENLLFFMDIEVSNSVNVMTEEGEVIGMIGQGELFDDNPIGNIVWIDDHREGHLWFVSRDNHQVIQLCAEARPGDQFNPQVVRSFDMPGVVNPHELDGIGHDGRNLIFGIRGRDDYLIVDDGWSEQYWLIWDPREGRVSPDEDMDVFGLLDMTGLIEGFYHAEIHIYSNDPVDDDVIVDISVHVFGFPNINITWSERAGFPDMIDFNALNNEVWTGYEAIVPLVIENIGTADLAVDGIDTDNDVFTVEPSHFVVSPGRRMISSINFLPVEPTLYEGVLTVVSNDGDALEITIPIRGDAADPPILTLSDSLVVLQSDGDMVEMSLEIGNIGVSNLRWNCMAFPAQDQNPNDSGWSLVTVEPGFGEVEPGDSINIGIRFDHPNDILPQEHFLIMIESNDPANRLVMVEVEIFWSQSVAGADLISGSPDRLEITSPHPNPFNSQATITFGLPRNETGDFGIYSLDGRRVQTLGGGAYSAGWHQVTIDAADLPAGIYLARLTAGTESATSRLVVVK